jgi:hypothetical protein
MSSNGQTTKTVRGSSLRLKAISLIGAIILTGCAGAFRTAEISEVNQIPDDCANREMIVKWLQYQLDNSKPLTTREDDFNAQLSTIKTKIWRLRYLCQPV